VRAVRSRIPSSCKIAPVRPSLRAGLAAALLLAWPACSSQTYVIVKLDAAPGVPPLVQLVLHAGDGNSSSTVTSPPLPAGQSSISFPKSYVVAVPKGALSVSVQVQGLDASGNTVAEGAAETLLTGVTATLSITLSQLCASPLDCGSAAVCSGATTCGDGGFCVAGSGQVAPDFLACDPEGGVCYAGQCSSVPRCQTPLDCGDEVCNGTAACSDGGYCVPGGSGEPAQNFTACNRDGGLCYEAKCIEPYCGDGILDEPQKQCDLGSANSSSGQCTLACRWAFCGDGLVDQDPMSDGGYFQEQCDWGSGADGGACVGPSGACNSDTLANHCRTNCLPARCGDGVVDTGERCDLGPPWPDGGGGNGTANGCNATCSLLEQVTTFAGNGTVGYADGPANQAEFDYPSGITLVGSTLYVADDFNDVIRTVDLGTGTVGTFAGQAGDEATVDGTGSGAAFYGPNLVRPYLSDLVVTQATYVRTATLGATVATLTGQSTQGYQNGTLAQAEFTQINGLAVSGDVIYVSDSVYGIRYVDPATDTVQGLTDAGSLETYTAAGLLSADGGLYFSSNAAIHLADTSNGDNSVVAGNPGVTGFKDGVGSSAEFAIPNGLCTDGDSIYVMDQGNSAVRQLVPSTRQVTTVAGDGLNLGGTVKDGTGRKATFAEPTDCVFDPTSGDLFVVDQESSTIRRVH
jgi:hypothetical protein